MKRFGLSVVAALLFAFAGFTSTHADPGNGNAAASSDVKTVSGKSACATCSGVTEAGHAIMLVDADGQRWVLLGDSDSYKAAHKVRTDDKKMTATLAGQPVTKRDSEGKEYKEVKVSDVKIES